jgi:hypothetical protein
LIVEHVDNNSPSLRIYLQSFFFQKLSKASKRAKAKFKSRFAKGESRTRKRTKIKFKINFAKTENRACMMHPQAP